MGRIGDGEDISCSARGVRALSEGCLFIERTEGAKGLELLYFGGGKAMISQDLTGFLSLSERQKPWTISASISFSLPVISAAIPFLY